MRPSLKLIFLLATLSGAAALSHELLWTRRLVDLLGATGEATARVFGCFFLGLSLGGLIAAYLLPRIKRPWFAIGYCELAIAALAVPALFLPSWTDWIWPAIGTESLAGWQGSLIKTILSAAVVLPPAIPMGMTLPFFVAAAAERHSASARIGVWIYSLNILGGVIGLLIASTILLEHLGVAGCMAAAIGVNLLVGSTAFFIGRYAGNASDSPMSSRASRRREERHQESGDLHEPIDFRSSILLAFFSGLATLMLELLAIQMISFIVPSSFQATAAVLAAVILVLAIASILTPILLRLFLTPREWLLISFAGAIVFTCLAPQILYIRSHQLVDVPHLAALSGGHLENMTQFLTAVCAIAFVAVGPALLLGGMVFPTILASTANDEKGVADGRRFGWLLAANGLGGIIGAELTNLLILPTWGIYQGFAAVGVLYALGIGLVLAPWKRSMGQPAFRVIAILFAIGAPIFWGSRYLSQIPYLSPRTKVPFKMHAIEFGSDGALLVVESPTNGKGILLNNQYLLGSSAGERDERRQVLIPMMLHPNPEQVCCVGLATGISAGAALDYPKDCQIQAVELSALVAAAAKNYFGGHNNHLFEEERVEVVIEDGRTYIAAAQDQFDVIVGDLYRPYGAGEARLFSVEHFHAARRALHDGGVFCQWLPMYQLTEPHFKTIAASFLEAFPNAKLIRANRKSDYPMLGLVGWKGEPGGSEHLAAVCSSIKASGRVNDPLFFDADAVLDLQLGSLDGRQFQDVPLNTLNNARIEIDAGRRKITHNPRAGKSGDKDQEPYLVGKAWLDFDKRLSKYLQQ